MGRCKLFFIAASIVSTSANAALRSRAIDDSHPTVTIPLTTMIPGSSMYAGMVHMGTPPQSFMFQIASTVPYTAIAGPSCATCSSNSSAPLFNPNASSSYVPPTTQQPISTSFNGKSMSGTLGVENCGLRQSNGSWWLYPDTAVLFGSGASQAGVLCGGSGVLGLAMSGAPSVNDTFLGQYLSLNSKLTSFKIGVALNSQSPGSDTSPMPKFDVSGASDSSPAAGVLHLYQPDPEYYAGPLVTLPAAEADTVAQFGIVPDQLGTYDWTVQIDGWKFADGSSQASGGQGTFATLEMSYPYILLTQSDANKIFSAVSGAQPYNVSLSTTTSTGAPVFDDTGALSWAVPCSSVADITISFTFNGTLTVPVQSNALYTELGGGICLSNIKGWADPQKTTSILGSAFLSSAYIVFSATPGAQSNSIGFANRLFTGNKKSEAGAIAGGVIGGVAFLVILGFLALFFIRRRRSQSQAPSASYLARDKQTSSSLSGGLFGFGGSRKDKSETEDNLVPEPYVVPAASPVSLLHSARADGEVVVQPWTPTRPGEEAFLSPETSAASPQDNQLQQQQDRSFSTLALGSVGTGSAGAPPRQMSPAFTMTTVSTPPPRGASIPPPPIMTSVPETLPPGAMAPGISPTAYEQRRAYEQQQAYEREHGKNGTGYSPVSLSSPGAGETPVMWVERSS